MLILAGVHYSFLGHSGKPRAHDTAGTALDRLANRAVVDIHDQPLGSFSSAAGVSESAAQGLSPHRMPTR